MYRGPQSDKWWEEADGLSKYRWQSLPAEGAVCTPSENSSNRTLKAPSIGAQQTSSIGRTVSPSVASKNVAPFAFSLHKRTTVSHPLPPTRCHRATDSPHCHTARCKLLNTLTQPEGQGALMWS